MTITTDELAWRGAPTAGRARAEASTAGPEPDELDAQHLRYFRTGDTVVRDELVMRYSGLARALAWRFVRAGEAAEDLEQTALLAVVGALERFDPTRGVSFGAYAWPTVVGVLKRYLRDRSWALTVPRSLKERSLALARVRADLTQELGRTPTLGELAEALDCDAEQLLEAIAAGEAHRPGSLDGALAELGQRQTAADDFATVDLREALSRLLDHLPAREREMMSERFFENLTQSEIGVRHGLSQMQVSRLLSRSTEILRILASRTSADLLR